LSNQLTGIGSAEIWELPHKGIIFGLESKEKAAKLLMMKSLFPVLLVTQVMAIIVLTSKSA
jgi:hypothetical protein